MGESTIKIIRNDRGLDFRRIEQFINMFRQKINSASSKLDKELATNKKTLMAEAYEHFGITAEVEAIKVIDVQIEALQEQREVHENKVRDFTQGTDSSNRYNTYDNIRENSPIHAFIDKGAAELEARKTAMRQLSVSLQDNIWFARDIDEAIHIYKSFTKELESI